MTDYQRTTTRETQVVEPGYAAPTPTPTPAPAVTSVRTTDTAMPRPDPMARRSRAGS